MTDHGPRAKRSPGIRSAFVTAVVALAIAPASALAQLPQLPHIPQLPQLPLLPDTSPTSRAVQDLLNIPLPAPVEDIVSGSPVAPIRDEVQGVVGGLDNVAGSPSPGGGSSGAGSSVAPPATTSGPSSPATSPGAVGDSPTGTTRSKQRRGAESRRTASGRSRRATPGSGVAAALSADRSARRARRAQRQGHKAAAPKQTQNPVVRTIVKIGRVVPTALWVALGALLALALAMSARALVERRRARESDRDRRRLMRDVGVLERALLPAVPEMLGALAISVSHRAAEGLAAGGDFYDAFELSGGRVALLVGDVSGHGPEALERTNSLRTALRACLEAGVGPRAALESVSRRGGIEPSGRFATVALAVHDPADGTLTYATAGHPPPILAGPGAHEPLTTASSPPMGAGLRTGLRETTVSLPSDTVACFFTDGLLEARMGGDLIGREELARFVAELGPEQYADSLLAQVIAVADSTPDDMVVCVLRPVGGAETASPRRETLELDAEDISLGLAARFLEACEVPAYQAATAVEALSTTAASAGAAVLEVTIDETGPRVRVTPAEAAPAGSGAVFGQVLLRPE